MYPELSERLILKGEELIQNAEGYIPQTTFLSTNGEGGELFTFNYEEKVCQRNMRMCEPSVSKNVVIISIAGSVFIIISLASMCFY